MRQLQSEPAGPVVVSCPVSIAQDILAPLPEFLDAWPAISVQLLVSNRRVDLISEGWTSRCGSAPSSTRTPNWWCATWAPRAARWSPARYLQRHGAPDTPQDLAAHTTLSFSDPQHEVRWRCATIRAKRSTSSSSPSCPATTSSCWSRPRCAGVASRCCRPSPRKRAAPRPAGARAAAMAVARRHRALHLPRRGMMPAVRTLLDFLSQRIPATYQRLERAPSPAVAAA